jgi:hypothetical protein
MRRHCPVVLPALVLGFMSPPSWGGGGQLYYNTKPSSRDGVSDLKISMRFWHCGFAIVPIGE